MLFALANIVLQGQMVKIYGQCACVSGNRKKALKNEQELDC